MLFSVDLVKNSRSREFLSYSNEQISHFIYNYLFLGLSFRQIDSLVLNLEGSKSRGWQSSSSLKYLGVIGKHKGILSKKSLSEVVENKITLKNKDHSIILNYLKIYSRLISDKDYVCKQNFENDFNKAVLLSLADNRAERLKRMKLSNSYPAKIKVSTYVYNRNPDVVAEVLYRAKGVCECCKKNAPFIKASSNASYLEVHHIKNLKDGGSDTVDNAEALCPNCHRKKHFGIE